MEKVNIEGEGDFKVVYDKYFNMVYRIALIYLKNIPEAEDIVQEVFIKLLNKRSFKSEEHMKAWLIRVSKNQCKDKLRSFWKSRRIDMEKLPEIPDEKERLDLEYVLEELLCLPSKYRIVLYLYYYEEYSVKDISKIIDIRESTIQTQLSRGRKLLKKNIEEGSYD